MSAQPDLYPPSDDPEAHREIIVVLKFPFFGRKRQTDQFVKNLQRRLRVEVDAGLEVMHHESNVIASSGPAMLNDEKCQSCDKTLSEHGVYHEPPPEGTWGPEAKFSIPLKGVYCPNGQS